jgi:rhodanese-related sulfurtransferase
VAGAVRGWTAGAPRPDDGCVTDRARRGVDALLAGARERITRLEPEEAWAAAEAGEVLLVDLRSSDERRRDGIVPGSVHVPRSVLEWRADPACAWCNPHLGGADRSLMLLCAQGFSSSLAAASLIELGRPRSGDVAGGFAAWRAAGLPIAPAPAEGDGLLPGTGPRQAAALPRDRTPDSID